MSRLETVLENGTEITDKLLRDKQLPAQGESQSPVMSL